VKALATKRLRAQHDLAPGVSLFQCAVGFLDLVEPEQPSDGNVELTARGEIGQLCEHARIGGVKVAVGSQPEFRDRRGVSDCVYALRRYAELSQRRAQRSRRRRSPERVDGYAAAVWPPSVMTYATRP
jgi:hypothetical protein